MLNVRVLVLSKRKYMGRDLIADRYGRFRELPLALSRHGAIVHGLCLGYRGGDEVSVLDESHGGRVDWDASKLSRLLPLGSGSYRRRIDGIAETFRPNLVWACSDTLHATLGAWAARRLGARLVVDLYDNFESYPLHRMPGMNALLRRALRRARAVTCVSEPLAEKVRDEYAVTAAVETIGNAVPDGLFIPQDKSACRRRSIGRGPRISRRPSFFGLRPSGLRPSGSRTSTGSPRRWRRAGFSSRRCILRRSSSPRFRAGGAGIWCIGRSTTASRTCR